MLGGQIPVTGEVIDEAAEISPADVVEPVEPRNDPPVAPASQPPAVVAATPVASSSATSERQRRWKPIRSTQQPLLPPDAQLSLVRVSDVESALVPVIRDAVGRHLSALRACCESVLRSAPVKGTIVAELTVRDSAVTAISVDSAIRDTSLRWCFRRYLMGARMPATSRAFDVRLEFFLTPRARRAGQ